LGKEYYGDMKNFSIQTIEIKRKTSAIEINLIDAYGSNTKKKRSGSEWLKLAAVFIRNRLSGPLG